MGGTRKRDVKGMEGWVKAERGIKNDGRRGRRKDWSAGA